MILQKVEKKGKVGTYREPKVTLFPLFVVVNWYCQSDTCRKSWLTGHLWINCAAFNISLNNSYNLLGRNINLKVKCFHKKGDYSVFHTLNQSTHQDSLHLCLLHSTYMLQNGSLNYTVICLQGRYVNMNGSRQERPIAFLVIFNL